METLLYIIYISLSIYVLYLFTKICLMLKKYGDDKDDKITTK